MSPLLGHVAGAPLEELAPVLVPLAMISVARLRQALGPRRRRRG